MSGQPRRKEADVTRYTLSDPPVPDFQTSKESTYDHHIARKLLPQYDDKTQGSGPQAAIGRPEHREMLISSPKQYDSFGGPQETRQERLEIKTHILGSNRYDSPYLSPHSPRPYEGPRMFKKTPPERLTRAASLPLGSSRYDESFLLPRSPKSFEVPRPGLTTPKRPTRTVSLFSRFTPNVFSRGKRRRSSAAKENANQETWNWLLENSGDKKPVTRSPSSSSTISQAWSWVQGSNTSDDITLGENTHNPNSPPLEIYHELPSRMIYEMADTGALAELSGEACVTSKAVSSSSSRWVMPSMRATLSGPFQMPELVLTSPNELPATSDADLWPAIFADGKTDISFENSNRWSLCNEAKGFVEYIIQEPINWWPLTPRQNTLPEDFTRVHWRCRCGKMLSSVISKARMNQYNKWLSASDGDSSPPEYQPSDGAQNNSASGGSGSSHRTPTTPEDSYSPPAYHSGSPIAASREQFTPGRVVHTQKKKLLLWCVNLGSRLTLVTDLDISPADNDAAVFRNLKIKYRKTRGWRWRFSLYCISEIKFVKFRPYRLDRVSCYNGEALPMAHDPHYQDYDYDPKPALEVPPLPVEQLMEYFEDPTCAGTSTAALHTFPKKLNGHLSREEKCGWGLRACERLSFFRICILSSFVVVGPIAFFVYWLLVHPGDLQNASVPLFIALALIGTFIVLPHYFGPVE